MNTPQQSGTAARAAPPLHTPAGEAAPPGTGDERRAARGAALQQVSRAGDDSPCVILAIGDPGLRHRLSTVLEARMVRVAHAKSAREVIEMLEDARFIGLDIDGLLISEQLPDATCWRVIDDLRSHAPKAAAGIVAENADSMVMLWANAYRVSVLRQPTMRRNLSEWLQQLRETGKSAFDTVRQRGQAVQAARHALSLTTIAVGA